MEILMWINSDELSGKCFKCFLLVNSTDFSSKYRMHFFINCFYKMQNLFSNAKILLNVEFCHLFGHMCLPL